MPSRYVCSSCLADNAFLKHTHTHTCHFQPLESISWLNDGVKFISSHSNSSINFWNLTSCTPCEGPVLHYGRYAHNTHMHTPQHTHAHTTTYTCTHTYSHTCAQSAHICTHTYALTHVPTHALTHMLSHTCTHMQSHTCTHTCAHTCTHTHTITHNTRSLAISIALSVMLVSREVLQDWSNGLVQLLSGSNSCFPSHNTSAVRVPTL